MKERRLCIATVFYIFGVIMGLYLKMSMAFFVVFSLDVLYVLYTCIIKSGKRRLKLIESMKICIRENKKYILSFCLLSVILILGIVSVKIADSRYGEIYKLVEDDNKVYIEAIVVSGKEEKDYYDKYEIKIVKINGDEEYKGIKVILRLRRNKQKENDILKYGDYITTRGEFEIPDTARNYGGFDYQAYLKTKKTYGTVYAKEGVKILKKDKGNILGKIIYVIQNNIKENLEKVLSEETKDLCVGILIGDTNDLSEEIEANFRDSNLIHMLAVSGSHVMYVILSLKVLLKKSGKKLSKIITIIFLIFFMALTGFSVSVIRACIMVIIVQISKLVYRKADIWTNLAISILIILIINPYSIIDIGFQLSFGGTIGIVILNEKIRGYIKEKVKTKNKIINHIIDILVVTLSANIIIIPIIAIHFNTLSLSFWLSNLVASPFMGIALILGFITYIFSIISISISKIIAIPLDYILLILIKIANICSNIPGSSIIVKTPYIPIVILYYCIIILILNRGNIKNKIDKDKIKNIFKNIVIFLNRNIFLKYLICFILILSLIIGTVIYNTNKKLIIYFIDVGQGDSTLIVTPNNKKILIDGGGSETFNVGEKVLLPYLLDRRINKLDYVMISHFDTDHVRRNFIPNGKDRYKKYNYI